MKRKRKKKKKRRDGREIPVGGRAGGLDLPSEAETLEEKERSCDNNGDVDRWRRFWGVHIVAEAVT